MSLEVMELGGVTCARPCFTAGVAVWMVVSILGRKRRWRPPLREVDKVGCASVGTAVVLILQYRTAVPVLGHTEGRSIHSTAV